MFVIYVINHASKGFLYDRKKTPCFRIYTFKPPSNTLIIDTLIDVLPVCEGGDDQTTRVAKVLVAIAEVGISLFDDAVVHILHTQTQRHLEACGDHLLPILYVFSITLSCLCPNLVPVQAELAQPVKGTDITTACFGQFANDITGVDLNGDQCDDLQAQNLW